MSDCLNDILTKQLASKQRRECYVCGGSIHSDGVASRLLRSWLHKSASSFAFSDGTRLL